MTTAGPIWEARRHAEGAVVERLSLDQLRLLIAKGTLTAADHARPLPHGDWREIGDIDALAGALSGSRSRRRRGRAVEEDDDFDMTPMIDVTFLLLIFFMVTASFNYQKGLDFPASQDPSDRMTSPEDAPGLDQFEDRLLVGIDRQDRYSFRDGGNPLAPGEPIAAADLSDALDRRSRADRKSKLLIVTDELTSHDAVVKLIDAASSVGIKEINLANIIDGTSASVAPAP